MVILFFPIVVFTQNLEKIGKSDLFKLTGGITANAIYYNGSSNKDSFTYILSGNINLNISEIYNIPFSFSYSNATFQKNNPFSFNRLSIHPSYKWITAHIGDVNMTFSSYTLSGHQFTGLGFDIVPSTKFKMSIMYGRLLEEREYNKDNLNGTATYKRNGYGLKTSYKFDKGTLGFIFFKAKDDESSLQNEIPVDKDIQPKENLVISLDGGFKVTKELSLKGEVAVSVLTEDTRVNNKSSGFFLSNNNATTRYYKAYNLNINYRVGKGEIGLGYERIDPNYKTLGGYYFNNDLENITVNASQRIIKDKLSIAFSGGLQKDNLDDSKESSLKRLVMSLNTSYNFPNKLAISAGYSSFQSFTNIKNQFDYINEISKIENRLDKFNTSQISQNANFNVNYTIKESKQKRKNLNIGGSYQNAVNRIDDNKTPDENSIFYNGNVAYTVGYLDNELSISGSLNVSYSKIVQNKEIIVGPIISANKSYFNKSLKILSSVSYNQSIHNGKKQGNITNLRLGARYVYKKRHNFSLNFLNQYKKSINNFRRGLTVTFGYNYSFGIFNSKNIKFEKNKKNKIKFKYRDSLYQGSIFEINKKLERLLQSSLFKYIPKNKKAKLAKYLKEIENEKNKKAYKIKAIRYLKDLYDEKKYIHQYNKLLLFVMRDLAKDIQRLDYKIEKDYKIAERKRIDYELGNKTKKHIKSNFVEFQEQYKILEKKEKNLLERLYTHRRIESKITKYKTIKDIEKEDEYLSTFFEQKGENIYKMLVNKENKAKIRLYLLRQIIDFYAKQSNEHIPINRYDSKYIDKQ